MSFSVVLGIIILGFIGIIAANLSKLGKWRKLPTLVQYLESNPACKTPNGIRCASCGSGSIKNWGEGRAESSYRTFICNQCGTKLYRSE